MPSACYDALSQEEFQAAVDDGNNGVWTDTRQLFGYPPVWRSVQWNVPFTTTGPFRAPLSAGVVQTWTEQLDEAMVDINAVPAWDPNCTTEHNVKKIVTSVVATTLHDGPKYRIL